MALLASMRRSVMNASPALSMAREMVRAASASPSARIMAACRSCSAYNVIKSVFHSNARGYLS